MKYLVILGDGMADRPLDKLGGKTPLEFAATPNFDKLAEGAQIGLVKTIPDGMKPGSDVANLSVLGYEPEKYYSGDDIAVRTNLVTLSDAPALEDKVMLDYSSGEISTAEAQELISAVQDALGDENFSFYSGVSYRHCLVIAHGSMGMTLTAPHDITDKKVGDYLPKGVMGEVLTEFIRRSGEILAKHPVNLKRIAAGKNPATHIWFWGAGTKPALVSFESRFKLKGAIISAVDLLKGIAKGTEMYSPNVKGATGTLSTNWRGKANAAKQCFAMGCDYVYLHMEAPDECGHQGIAVLPDHATPICVKTHTSEPVPYMIYRSDKPMDMGLKYNEKEALNGIYLPNGQCITATLTEDGNA